MSKYPSTNIVYSGVEDKGGPTVTILDEKKNKWTIWKKDYENKDQDSEAYSSLRSYVVGESFGVEYGEKEESFVKKDGKDAGKTVNFTRRTIYKILPLVSHPTTVTSQRPKSSNVGHSRAPGRGSGGRNYDREGYEKCAWTYFVDVCNGDLDLFGKALVDGIVYDAFQAIEADGAKRFSVSEPNLTREDLPTIHVDDEVNVEGIPFS